MEQRDGCTSDVREAPPPLNLQFPLGQSELHPCLVKVYDSGAESELKLNDVVEFVGVLAVDPVLAGGGLGDGGEEDMMAEMDVNAILPPSRVGSVGGKAGQSAETPPPSHVPPPPLTPTGTAVALHHDEVTERQAPIGRTAQQ